MVGDFIIRKHSARTADARLTPLAHSLCSYARPHTLDGHAVYVVSLSLQIRTLPLVARGGMLARLPPRSLLPTLLWSHGLFKRCRFAPILNHADLLYNSY